MQGIISEDKAIKAKLIKYSCSLPYPRVNIDISGAKIVLMLKTKLNKLKYFPLILTYSVINAIQSPSKIPLKPAERPPRKLNIT